MKCETCASHRMCYLRRKYSEIVGLIVLRTNTDEPEYSETCKQATKLYDVCVHYETKP